MVLSLRNLTASVFCFIAIACNEKNPDQVPPLLVIAGFQVTDALGNDLVHYGPNDNDWEIREWSSLTAKEQGFLNFSDNIDMANTVVTALNRPGAFPNPFANFTAFAVQANDSVKLKLAVVDSTGHVYLTRAEKFKGIKVLNLDFSNVATFPDRMSLRYYFSFSAASQANFKAGSGDVKICRTFTGSGDVLQCFN